ncbi:MAG: hypothetical protein K8R41_01220 [Bacteroidales bacterium]|nr:hypothetical protein [Bacteroidales bacterium]
MSKNEIVVALFTVVYGLMLTDLFASLHKLIKARKIVKWHWFPLLASWYLFLLIIKNWWDMAIPDNNLKEYSIISFVVSGHFLILLYLLVSVVLPDNIQKKGVNLKEYYFQNHRYFWGLMTVVGLISILIYVVPKLIQSSPLNMYNIIANIIFLLLTILLAISKRYWIHSVLLVFFTIINLLEIAQNI